MNINNATTTTTSSSPIVADTQSLESKLWWGEFQTMVNARSSRNPFTTQSHHTLREVVVEQENLIALQDEVKKIERKIKNLLITVRNPIFERVPDKITEKYIFF